MQAHHFSKSALKALLIGAAALGIVVVAPGPQAKAACLNAGCSNFDPTSPTPVTVNSFTGSVSNKENFDSAEVRFSIATNNLANWATPFTITNLTLSGDSLTGPVTIGDGTLLINGALTVSASIPLNAGSSFDFANSVLTFTIPTGATSLNSGASLTARIRYFDSADPLDSLASSNFSATALNAPEPVPGPLPLLGASAAFAYSRKLRRRISKAT